MAWVSLQSVNVPFPGHTHLLCMLNTIDRHMVMGITNLLDFLFVIQLTEVFDRMLCSCFYGCFLVHGPPTFLYSKPIR